MGRFCFAALIAVAAISFAQEQEPVFRVDVQLVRVLATVKNLSGAPVGGLEKDAFKVTVDDKPQQIAVFERFTEQPLSVAVLLDISGSTAKEMEYQSAAVTRFLNALFSSGNPLDTASLFAFNWQVQQAVDYTRRPERFTRALRKLRAEAGTALYDAVFLAARDIEDREGRHVLIVVTDGGDTVSNTEFNDALRAAHRADAVVYAILTMPITSDAGRNIGGENALTMLTGTTGGKVFTPAVNTLDIAFSDILKDLRTQYLLGFYPRAVEPTDSGFYQLKISTTDPGLRVVSRTGYYGDTDPAAKSGRRSRR
jgi:Ca-activated chloride channel family protein